MNSPTESHICTCYGLTDHDATCPARAERRREWTRDDSADDVADTPDELR